MRSWRCWVLLLVVGCTKPNPAVCCLDANDCASIGVADPERTCADGLACVNNACVVPTCSTDGCSAEAPVCDITTDVCTGCTVADDCDQFDKLCDSESGACVECVSAADCGIAKPVCDASICRGCVLDSDCDSGACGEAGACVDEGEIVYMDPTGTDAGTCPRSSPCKSIEFAVGQASIARAHIVFAPGTYVEIADVDVTPVQTSAPSLTFHGGGATVTGDSEETILITIPATFRDLTILNTGSGNPLIAASQIELERVNIAGRNSLRIDVSVTARDLNIDAQFSAITLSSGSSLDLDRATLKGVDTVVDSGVAINVNVLMKNTLIFGSNDIGVRLQNVTGALDFVTIANTGVGSSTNTAGLLCGQSLAVRSSIVWTPNTSKLPISGACVLTDVTAGPASVAGADNSDPLFANPAAGDFHLGVGSPARDAVNAGPAFDFEGEPRPQGDRFDLGADEAAP